MAHAGLLSSLLSVLSGENDQEVSRIITNSEYNSQTLPLPSPALNTNPSTARGGGDVTVVGGEALLPAIGPMGVSADTGVRMATGQISTYIVRKGDTLSQIADMFGVTVNTIRWANDIKGQTVRLGQDLAILPVSGLKYTIKNGGSLRDVVKKYGGNIDEAALFNDLDPDEELEKGTIVVIPDAEFEEVKPVQKVYRKKYARRYTGVRGGVTARAHHTGGAYLPGFFVHPLAGRGVKTQGLHGYNAVDFGAPVGTPIVAAASGKVVIAKHVGYNGGFGIYSVIEHVNGTRTVYAHMSRNASFVGQTVVQGQIIGYTGNTGRSTGPHLHFEVRGAANPF